VDAAAAAAGVGGARGPGAGGDREVSPSLTITVLDPVSSGEYVSMRFVLHSACADECSSAVRHHWPTSTLAVMQS
jgi:hypothetical protein